MAEAIAEMRSAFTALSRGEVDLPLRTHIKLSDPRAMTLTMPCVVRRPELIGTKLLTILPPRAVTDSSIHGVVVMFDSATGAPWGVVEGNSLTAIRTGAVSGLATDLLARTDASVLAIIGSGTQARTQLEAMCVVRPIEQIRVFSRTRGHAQAFANEMSARIEIPISVAATPVEAVRGAHIICTATPTQTPVVSADVVDPAVHINAVGSFTPEMQEIAPALVTASIVCVDSREAALKEAGELIAAVNDLQMDPDTWIELGALVTGQANDVPKNQPTLFKSVGLAVQDLFAASRALTNASRDGSGQQIPF